MGIYWNLHISVEDIYKVVFWTWRICFSFRETFRVCFPFAVVWFGLFFLNVHAAEKDLFFTCLKRKETQKVSFAISL